MIWSPREKSIFQKYSEGRNILHIIDDEIRKQSIQVMFYLGEDTTPEGKYKIAVDTCIALNADTKNADKYKP